MIIYSPYIKEYSSNKIRLCCDFETQGETKTLWYEVDKQWEDYLVTEQSDAFVVGLLVLALKNGEDIIVQGNMSRRLFYGIANYVVPSLIDANLFEKKINIECQNLSLIHFQRSNTNATGISCGIDSLSTYLNNEMISETLKIDILTFFNVGSNGDYGGENARKLFNYRVKEVHKFCDFVKKSLMSVDSNLSELLTINFAATATLRNISVVLCLQKLFSNYYYASGVKYDIFMLSSQFMGYYDLLVLHGLSTETTQFYSSMTHLTREERTELVGSYHDLTSSFLDVCVSLQPEKSVKNCSKCYKCMMTQVTLEVNGMLDNFNNVFNLQVYKENKTKFIGLILFKRNTSKVYLNLYNYLKLKGFKFKFIHHYSKYHHSFLERKKKIKKSLSTRQKLN